jgi:transposase
LDPYKPYLRERATGGVLNAVKLLPEVRRHGYPGGVTLIREFLHPLRPAVPVVTERFETEPGQQAQVDWAACGRIWYRDRLRSLSSFTMTLGYSLRQYLGFTVSEDMETFQRCHIDAFRYFCGVPSEILYDNLKTAVDHRGPDGQVVWNKRFRDFADYYGFVPLACQPYRAQTKGKVENGIRYVKGNFLLGLDVAQMTLEELNGEALRWLRETADVRVHGTTHESASGGLAGRSGSPEASGRPSRLRHQLRELPPGEPRGVHQLPRLSLLRAAGARRAPAAGQRGG